MDYGIELTFTDGTKEWFGPVGERTENDVMGGDQVKNHSWL